MEFRILLGRGEPQEEELNREAAMGKMSHGNVALKTGQVELRAAQMRYSK